MNATIDEGRYSVCMTSLQTPTVRVGDSDQGAVDSNVLEQADADTYAQWFACLAEPMRVRLLHRVASAAGGITIGALAEALGIGQPTVSHHVRKLADVGFVSLRKEGTSTVVAMNPTCCVALPQAADIVMGVLAPRPCCPSDLPDDVAVRVMSDDDWDAVLRIYGEGIATRNATFTTEAPSREHPRCAVATEPSLGRHHRRCRRRLGCPESGVRAGLLPRSRRKLRLCRRRDARTRCRKSIATQASHGSRRRRTLDAADVDLPENRASVSLHHSAGFRTIGIREKIAQLDGIWRDTVLLERRSVADPT